MLGFETLAAQTLATSARETPYAAKFAEVQRAAVYDLIWLVELKPYLAAAPLYEPPRPRFTYEGSGGAVSSGIGSYYYQAPEPGVDRGIYEGVGGAVSSGAAATVYVAAAPAAKPSIPDLIADYDADANSAALSIVSGQVSQWRNIAPGTGPDISLDLNFLGMVPEPSVLMSRSTTKVVYRAGPTVALIAAQAQALTYDIRGQTALGLLIEGWRPQLLQNSKLSGGGTNPTGWATITSGGRIPVTSIFGGADGATAYRMTASAQRPYLRRTCVWPDSQDFCVQMIIESASGITDPNTVILSVSGGLGTGGGGTTSLTWGQVPTTFPCLVEIYFYTGTGNTLTYANFGLGAAANATGTLTISRPQVCQDRAYASSFIPTNNGETSVVGDQDYLVRSPLTLNESANSFVLQGRTGPPSSGSQVFMQADAANFQNCYRLERQANKHFHYWVRRGNVTQVDMDLGVVADYTDFTLRVANQNNNVRASLNGGTVVSDTSVTLPSGVNTMRLGQDSVGELLWDGTVAVAEAWQSAKTDSELQNGFIPSVTITPALNQTVAANRPDRLQYAQNGRDIVEFVAASGDHLISAATTGLDAFWNGGAYVCMMARLTSLGLQSAGRIMERNTGGGGWYLGLQAGTVSGAQLVFRVGYSTTDAIYATNDFPLGPLLRQIEIEFNSATPATLPVIRMDGAAMTVRVVQAGSGSYSEVANSPFAISNLTRAFDGHMAQLMLYGSVPTTQQKTDLRAWLDGKWDRTKVPPLPPGDLYMLDSNGLAITDELGAGIE
jgi:hypothetical protein